MDKKKVGICTVFTGYNYGSSLQAYATKKILTNLGYEPSLLKLKGSLVAGRDIRFKKLFTIATRSILHRQGIKNFKKYKNSLNKKLSWQSKVAFNSFVNDYLRPDYFSYSKLKKVANGDEYFAFLCGSDQVWNGAVYYVDPFYYLRFAPFDKRIAFAPSFGRDAVSKYNKKKIAKYVSAIKYKSVREETGKTIVKDLTGADCDLLLDPTLAISKQEWIEDFVDEQNAIDEKYMVAYFLDEPSEKAIIAIEKISKETGLKVITLPYKLDGLKDKEFYNAGPKEFINLMKNASFVCTDSFHGTAFSINFNLPFYAFERNYGASDSQSSRIKSILTLTKLLDRYEPEVIDDYLNISFDNANAYLDKERKHSKEFLINALGEELINNSKQSK